MTFNVFGFDKDSKNKNKSITSIIMESEADVILIQEDKLAHDFNVDGYERVVECETSQIIPTMYMYQIIANSILVSKQYLNKNHISNTKSIDVTHGCPTPRCAAFVEFDNGISIVNTHFCGGKYDDRSFANNTRLIPESILYAKNNALHDIFNTFGNITIIGGDFNGMKNHNLNEQLFKVYPLYKDMSDANKRYFSNFFQTPHILLTQNGYISAYNEQDVIKTAQIGPQINVPDWIYINAQIKHFVKEVNVIDAITKPHDASDHNPVTVTVELNISHSKRVESDETLNGYYVLHTVHYFNCITASKQQQLSHNNCNGSNDQVFFIKLNREENYHKYYTIQSNQSELYWTINTTNKLSQVYQQEYTGYDNQIFEFIHHKSVNTYNIRIKQNGKNLAVHNEFPNKYPAIFQHYPSDENNQIFIVYNYLSEIRRQRSMENLIDVQECIENIPLIQTFIEHNIIQPMKSKYFPQRTAQEVANITTDGYNKNTPIDAVKFFTERIPAGKKQYNSSTTSMLVYHGVINPMRYDNILLKREGLKAKMPWGHRSATGHTYVLFLTPSYILASQVYGTLYVFQDYVYSITLQVEVDISNRIKTHHNTSPLKNIDPNIADTDIEWVYREHNVQIVGLIVKKHKRQDIKKWVWREKKIKKHKEPDH
eukprot:34717_1